MPESKKCPMTFGKYNNKVNNNFSDCIEDQCAWWIGGYEITIPDSDKTIRTEDLCAIKKIARDMLK